MPLDYDVVMAYEFPEIEQAYGEKDTILYALAVGLGFDPVDADELEFVFEKKLKALPTMAGVLCAPGSTDRPGFNINQKMIVAAEHKVVIHHALPPAGVVAARTRIPEIIDKGADRGALIYTERDITDKSSGRILASVHTTIFARGDGGFGGAPGPGRPAHKTPDRVPDQICDLPTLRQMALIYRLCGDLNPLHADPERARSAGFERPILHGLGTFGVAGHAILKTCCAYDVAKFKSIEARFSKPVFPGDTIRTEIWRDGATVSFRVRALERDVVVLTNGRAEIL